MVSYCSLLSIKASNQGDQPGEFWTILEKLRLIFASYFRSRFILTHLRQKFNGQREIFQMQQWGTKTFIPIRWLLSTQGSGIDVSDIRQPRLGTTGRLVRKRGNVFIFPSRGLKNVYSVTMRGTSDSLNCANPSDHVGLMEREKRHSCAAFLLLCGSAWVHNKISSHSLDSLAGLPFSSFFERTRARRSSSSGFSRRSTNILGRIVAWWKILMPLLGKMATMCCRWQYVFEWYIFSNSQFHGNYF